MIINLIYHKKEIETFKRIVNDKSMDSNVKSIDYLSEEFINFHSEKTMKKFRKKREDHNQKRNGSKTNNPIKSKKTIRR